MKARWTGVSVAVAAVLVSSVGISPAGSVTPLPRAGTAAEVAGLVAASHTITRLPPHLVPSLTQASADQPVAYYATSKNACDTPTKCVYGDVTSKTDVILFGDSHAYMWLPALAPDATALKVRLSLMWSPGCPVIEIPLTTPACQAFRKTAITVIDRLHPADVLVADKTSEVLGTNGQPISNTAWQAGMENTLKSLKQTGTKVDLIGDITQMDDLIPTCLSQWPTNVQRCAVKNPNPKFTQHFAAEAAAAKAERVPYIATQQWMCASTCSPIVGAMVTYWDNGHVSATYAAYLSGVWKTALIKLGV